MTAQIEEMGKKIERIIAAAGGEIVGRTRLQKIAYLLELSGNGEGFTFDYHYYGPYSEDLAKATHIAEALKFVEEEDKATTWGGHYSIYRLANPSDAAPTPAQTLIASLGASANAVVLELAATAAYFADHNHEDPWRETEERKPDKATPERLQAARELYAKLCGITNAFPQIA